MSILERINGPEDLKDIDISELVELAEEIRQKIISVVSETGGHLASNLGVVELTIAIHSAFELGKDKIVWDVGHQCYPHKVLTERRDRIRTRSDGVDKTGNLVVRRGSGLRSPWRSSRPPSRFQAEQRWCKGLFERGRRGQCLRHSKGRMIPPWW